MRTIFNFILIGGAVYLVGFSFVALRLFARRSPDGIGVRGKASWYGEGYRGKTMANGHPFDPDAMTCASWRYPFGTLLCVRHVASGRVVYVEVTDRGPAPWTKCMIDLSARAFRRLAPPSEGKIIVDVVVVDLPATAEGRK